MFLLPSKPPKEKYDEFETVGFETNYSIPKPEPEQNHV